MSKRIEKIHSGVLAGVAFIAGTAFIGPAQGSGYPIISKVDSTCLSALSTIGSPQTFTCSTSNRQRFHFRASNSVPKIIWGGDENLVDTQIIFDHSRKCLAVGSGYIYAGTPIRQLPCDQTERQLWDLIPIDNSYFEIVNVGTGLCLTQSESYPGCPPGSICMPDVNQVEVNLCRDRKEQYWNIARVHRIVAAHSNRCLDVEGRSTNAVGNVIQNTCREEANQLWLRRPDIDPVGETSPKHWVNLRSGLCLDAYNYNGHTNVDQYYCDNYTSQLWKQKYANFGTSVFQPDMGGTGYCMDVKGSSKSSGANVQRYRCHRGTNQQWKVVLE